MMTRYLYFFIIFILVYHNQIVNCMRMNITQDIRGKRMASFTSFRFDSFGEYSFNATAVFQKVCIYLYYFININI